MIVIADTSPINYLICIGEIDVLPRLYGVVIIPRAVRDELSRDRASRGSPARRHGSKSACRR
jgi:predicted nucleic acid-binding protein